MEGHLSGTRHMVFHILDLDLVIHLVARDEDQDVASGIINDCRFST